MGGRKWTESEKDYLRQEYPSKKAEEIAEELDRSVNSIHSQANKSGIKSDHTSGKRWTDKEAQFLKNNYKKKSVREIADSLDRSYKAIQAQGDKLDLTENRKIEIDEKTLKDLYIHEQMSSGEIAEEFDCSRSTIWRKLEKSGIAMRGLSESISLMAQKHPHYQEGRNAHFMIEAQTIDWKPIWDEHLAYTVGAVDGDGWCSNGPMIEVSDLGFAKKFLESVREIGLHPHVRRREREHDWKGYQWKSKMIHAYGCSVKFADWYKNLTYEDRFQKLSSHDLLWRYLDGFYDAEGSCGVQVSLSQSDVNLEIKNFVIRILNELDLEFSSGPEGIQFRKGSARKFLNNIRTSISRKKEMR